MHSENPSSFEWLSPESVPLEPADGWYMLMQDERVLAVRHSGQDACALSLAGPAPAPV